MKQSILGDVAERIKIPLSSMWLACHIAPIPYRSVRFGADSPVGIVDASIGASAAAGADSLGGLQASTSPFRGELTRARL
jgi:hypothetical protein